MPIQLDLDLAALASHRPRMHSESSADRPVRLSIPNPGDDWNVALLLPGVRPLSRMMRIAPAHAINQHKKHLVVRTAEIGPSEAFTPHQIAALLRAEISALPDSSAAGQAYQELRAAGRNPHPDVDGYVFTVATEFVKRHKPLPQPKLERDAQPSSVRSKKYRDRRNAIMNATSLWALDLIAEADDLRPGGPMLGGDFHSLVVQFISDDVADYEASLSTTLDGALWRRYNPPAEVQADWDDYRLDDTHPAPPQMTTPTLRALYTAIDEHPRFARKRAAQGNVVILLPSDASDE